MKVQRFGCALTLVSAAIAVPAIVCSPAQGGPGCEPACANSIFAPTAAQEGDVLSFAYTISVQNTGVECAAIPNEARFWLPNNLPDDPNQCEASNGLQLPLPAVTLNPGEFIRFSGTDTGLVDCTVPGQVNCEVVVPELVYVAASADAVSDEWLVFGCWSGAALPGGEPVECSASEFTDVVAPDITISKSADITRVCEGVDTEVTYTYLVTDGDSNVDIINVLVTDDLCGPVMRIADNPGNNNKVLEDGEVWVFECTTTINTETTNTATVTGNDMILGRAVSANDVLTIPANDPPTCVVDPPMGSICQDSGNLATFCVVPSGTGPFTFEWTGPDGFTSTDQCITVGVAGMYCATVTDANGCVSDECCATLVEYNNPNVTIMGSECLQDLPGDLCATVGGGAAPYTVVWTDQNGTVVAQCDNVPEGGVCCIQVSDTDLYTATATDANGCVGSETSALIIFPQKAVNAEDVSGCADGQIEVCATVAGGTAPYTVVVRDPAGQIIETCIDVPEGGQCCVNVDLPGTYEFCATDANDCESCDTAEVSVDEAFCDASAEPDTICVGESSEICVTLTEGDHPPFTVDIYNQNGVLMETCDGLAVGQSCCVTVTPPSDGTFTFHAVITDSSGCVFGSPLDGACTVDLTVNPEPTCDIDPPAATICEDDVVGAEFCVVPSGVGPFTFDWTGPGGFTSTDQCITALEPGLYCAVVTDANGCESEPCCATLIVRMDPPCEITGPTDVMAGDQDVLYCGPAGQASYSWSVTGDAVIDGPADQECVLIDFGKSTGTVRINLTVANDTGCDSSCNLDINVGDGGEGCTPGYWKQPHHFDDWTAPYDPDDLFSDHFEDAFPGKTLLTVLSQPASAPPGPNALNSLGRHTVAALLNAASPDVDFGISEQAVIDMFNAVYPGTDEEYLALKNIFAEENELGCPLNGNSDLNYDGLVDVHDLILLFGSWGTDGVGDVNRDGIVDLFDLKQMIANWNS